MPSSIALVDMRLTFATAKSLATVILKPGRWVQVQASLAKSNTAGGGAGS